MARALLAGLLVFGSSGCLVAQDAASLVSRARARELMAGAELYERSDPALSLYLGWQAAQLGRPLPPGLQDIMAEALRNGPSYGILRDGSDVYRIAWSPDGKTLASVGEGPTVRIWDPARGQLLETLPGEERAVSDVAWSPDGKTLASADISHTVRLWDAASWKLLRVLQVTIQEVSAVAWRPDGKVLATAGNDGSIRLWDTASGQQRLQLNGQQWIMYEGDLSPGPVDHLAWSPDGKRLACSGEHSVLLWDAVSWRVLRVLGTVPRDLWGSSPVVWSPDGSTLAYVGADRTIRLWDVARGTILKKIKEDQDSNERTGRLSWSPDGKLLLSGSANGTIRVWDWRQEKLLRVLQGHGRDVTGFAWRPDGKAFASSSYDGTIRLWEAPSDFEKPLRTLEGGNREEIRALAWSPDGKRLASTVSGAARIWEVATGQTLRTLDADRTAPISLAWSADGKTLMTAPPQFTPAGVHALAWSPDRTVLASGDLRMVELWDAASGKRIATLEGHQGEVGALAWSPDGKILASGSDDQTIRLWDPSGRSVIRTLEGHPFRLIGLAWSPDGTKLASACAREIRVWEAATGKLPLTVKQYNALTVVWSPDGKTLATGGQDGKIRLWDAGGGRVPLYTFSGEQGHVNWIAWSPDGSLLATAGPRRIRIWRGGPESVIEAARNAIRLYTPSERECQRYFEDVACGPAK